MNAPVPFLLHVLAPRLAQFHRTYLQIGLTLDMTDTPVDLMRRARRCRHTLLTAARQRHGGW